MTTRFPRELYEWLRAEAFETRESMNSIIIASVRERRARTATRGKQVHHRDGNPRNNDPANLELKGRS